MTMKCSSRLIKMRMEFSSTQQTKLHHKVSCRRLEPGPLFFPRDTILKRLRASFCTQGGDVTVTHYIIIKILYDIVRMRVCFGVCFNKKVWSVLRGISKRHGCFTRVKLVSLAVLMAFLKVCTNLSTALHEGSKFIWNKLWTIVWH